MTDNQRRILEMLAEKKISVDEAERLLALTEQPAGGEAGVSDTAPMRKSPPKYLRVLISSTTKGDSEAKAEQVNIRVPLSLIRAGMKLTAFIPLDKATQVNEALKSKGLDFDVRNVKGEDLQELLDALSDLEIDIHNDKEKVHIYVE